MKRDTKKKICGSISVLLVVILLPMMTFAAVIVDVSRINMAKQMMSSAGDLTMNTALANYDTILKDVYGLFAMSQIENKTNDELGTALNDYFARTLTSYGVVSEEDADDYVALLIGDFRDFLNDGALESTNFLELSNIQVKAEKVPGSSLANTGILRKQILEYMKYRAPLGVGLSFLESLTAFEKLDEQNDVVEAQVVAQESTQDVTQACKTLIELIRAYDKRIVEIDVLLTGKTKSSDTATIPLEDYDSHVLNYQSAWGENYAHINKLNLVFLAHTPSTNGYYLKNLNYSGNDLSKRYIAFDGTMNGAGNSSITASISKAGDLNGAESAVYNHINNVMNASMKNYVGNYASPKLPISVLDFKSNNDTGITFKSGQEENAINCFIAYEYFLINDSRAGDFTYSDVQKVLENLKRLDLYRQHFQEKMNAALSTARTERTRAWNYLQSCIRENNAAVAEINRLLPSIQNRLKAFVEGKQNDVPLRDLLLEGLLEATEQNWTGYTTFVWELDRIVKSNPSPTVSEIRSNPYTGFYNWIIGDSGLKTKGTSSQIKIIKHFTGENTLSSVSSLRSDPLFILLDCLKNCSSEAASYDNAWVRYEAAQVKISEARADYNAKDEIVKGLEKRETDVNKAVKNCQKDYSNFCSNYQEDLYHYNQYISAAKNTIGPEAVKIKDHFIKLQNNLFEIIEDLQAIETQIGKVQEAIKTYNENVGKWEKANNTYASTNGSDDFSSQNKEDIQTASEEYKTELYNSLKLFVSNLLKEYNNLYTKLKETSNFKYGAKRIDAIQTADDLINAVKGTTLSNVVTVDEAANKFTWLYVGETIEYDPFTIHYENDTQKVSQLQFLQPSIVQLQALKYLNGAYPPSDVPLTEDQKNTKAQYENTKAQLKGEGEAKGDTVEEAPSTGYGYTFKKKDLEFPGTLPSGGKEGDKQYDETEHKVTEAEENGNKKLNASESVKSQNSTGESILSGLGNIATKAVENLYILNYICENFSCNTTVQEAVLENMDMGGANGVWMQMSLATSELNNSEKIEEAKKYITTLSNYSINEKNNYLFGGEQEYILFGKHDGSANVTSVKAGIYAIRFAFNCIFAFTDSGIRNSTRAAGLAVQAATLGVVPYQVVQIVLQLALAAAESAVDLSAMTFGLSVAIIKTKDTWALGVEGAKTGLQDLGNIAAEKVGEKLSTYATNTIAKLTDGLNNLLDEGAEELKNNLKDVKDNLETAAKGVLESVVDDVIGKITMEVDTALNELIYVGLGGNEMPTREDVQTKADEAFGAIRSKVESVVSTACGNNQMALAIAAPLKEEINRLIGNMETKVSEAINTASEVDITGYIAGELANLKKALITECDKVLNNLTKELNDAASEAIDATKEEIQTYIDECSGEITEQMAETIKEKVKETTDSFVSTTLNLSGSDNPATELKSSPLSMFRFGYKDYLMLLLYINICVNSDNILLRTADVIQLNMNNKTAGSELLHPVYSSGKKEPAFLMSDAYTYLTITGTADMDMFFMDLDLFAQVVAPESEEGFEEPVTTTNEEGKTKITYRGFLGY